MATREQIPAGMTRKQWINQLADKFYNSMDMDATWLAFREDEKHAVLSWGGSAGRAMRVIVIQHFDERAKKGTLNRIP
jgi:hypothetical protein